MVTSSVDSLLTRQHKAMSDAAIVAIVTAIAGVIAGFFKLIDNQNKLHEKLSKSIDSMAKASKEVASATKKSAKEAAERNGHLADITVQQADRIAQIVTHIKEQHVINQHVDTETVNKKG